jgi:metallo-beta-lactamase family protein
MIMSEQENKLRIKFLGAIGTVTGSCTLLEFTGYEQPPKYYLVDIGAYQGEQPVPDYQKILKAYAKDLKAVFITHAHLDHIGLLPSLIEWGFKGDVRCTEATQELMKVMLTDALKIQKQDPAIIDKIHFKPVDDERDGHKFSGFARTFMHVTHDFHSNIHRASHILGSVSWSFQWTSKFYPKEEPASKDREWRSLYFSGDIGPVSETFTPNILFKRHQPPYYTYLQSFIVLESTYGDRVRDKTEYTFDRRIDRLQEIIEMALRNEHVVIIPAFALDRAQQIHIDLYYIIKEKKGRSPEYRKSISEWNRDKPLSWFIKGDEKLNKIKTLWERIYTNRAFDIECLFNETSEEIQKAIIDITHPNGPLKGNYPPGIQSPLILGVNKVYKKYLPADSCSDEDLKYKYKYLSKEFAAFFCPEGNKNTIANILSAILPAEAEKSSGKRKIIISASGMCDEGAVVNLLTEYLPQEKATIILTGFQAPNTNGRFLQELYEYDEAHKNQTMLTNIDLRLSEIKADIITEMSPYYSGHADQEQLVSYVTGDDPKHTNTAPTTVFLNHGTDESREKLKEAIDGKNKENISVKLPPLNRWINLNTGEEEDDDEADIERMTPSGSPVDEGNQTLKYFCINGVHFYVPIDFDDTKITKIINCVSDIT